VRARLARLDTRHRAVLGTAAVLGRRFDWQLLERVAGVEGRDVTEALHRYAGLQLIAPTDRIRLPPRSGPRPALNRGPR